MPPTQSPLAEALDLADETLRQLELEQLPLPSVAMRAGRIARLMNEGDWEQIFRFEVGGYPTTDTGLTPEVWRLAGLANRYFSEPDPNTGISKQLAYLESIEAIATGLAVAREQLPLLGDHPNDSRWFGNTFEKIAVSRAIDLNVKRLAARRALVFDYLSSRYYALRYSGITADAFSRLRATVDARIAQYVPTAVQRFDSIYANLQSENAEDWANAVHGCRRILEHLADALFPPGPDRQKDGKQIRLGPTNYRNRLLCYVDDRSQSPTFNAVVGSTFTFLADRLESLFDAANKGTHAHVSKEEADRYVIYTYLVIGDILSV